MPADSPSIDVLLATYNGARYLRPQIESVLNQKDVSFRILVRDDGSMDETPAVIEHYKRLKPECIIHLGGPDNLGVVDDTLRERHSSYWRFAGVYPNRSTLPRLLIKNPVAGCASLANQALVRLALPVPRAALMHDYWLTLVACAAGHVGAVEEPLMLYRQHERNTIGARPYNWRTFLDRLTDRLAHWDLPALRRQAAALSARCNSVLTAEDRALIDDFVDLPKRTWIGQRWFLLRHGIEIGRAHV